MIKCPGCNRQHEESPQCEGCGLVAKEIMEPTRRLKTARYRRIVWYVLILATAGALVASYGFTSFHPQSSDKTTIAINSSDRVPKSKEGDLGTMARELSGDVGIVKHLADGSTKGSVIAMFIFSIIGIGYFSYGKKSQHFIMLICGIALMGYSYFVNGTAYIILIGVALSALPFIIGRK